MLALNNIIMKKLLCHIILIACAVMFSISGTSMSIFANETPIPEETAAREIQTLLDPNEAALFELINAARKSPLDMAEFLGMDPNQLLKDFPEMADILISGLPELSQNVRLVKTATEHTADMLKNGYYSYDSIDGRSVDQRMTDAGYIPAEFGESLGMIAFNNFLNSQKAVLQIFKNIYQNELDSAFEGQRNILNPNVTDVGVSFQGGVFTFGRFTVNSYFVTCDFARPVEIYELQLVNLINQLRADPWSVLAAYKMDVNSADFPEFEILLTKGVPPLAYNPLLYAAAEELVTDLYENDHYAAKTSDGRTLADRVAKTGYASSWIGESRSRLSTCGDAVSPEETVSRMFRYLVNRAFQTDPERRSYAMLTPIAKDCGIRIMAGESVEMSGICGDNLHILVADFGAKHETGDFVESEEVTETDNTKVVDGRVSGLIYEDINANSLYDIGEEYPGIQVTVATENESDVGYEVITNAAGGYVLDLPQGNYRVTVNRNSEILYQWMDITSKNATWMPMKLDMPVENSEK